MPRLQDNPEKISVRVLYFFFPKLEVANAVPSLYFFPYYADAPKNIQRISTGFLIILGVQTPQQRFCIFATTATASICSFDTKSVLFISVLIHVSVSRLTNV